MYIPSSDSDISSSSEISSEKAAKQPAGAKRVGRPLGSKNKTSAKKDAKKVVANLAESGDKNDPTKQKVKRHRPHRSSITPASFADEYPQLMESGLQLKKFGKIPKTWRDRLTKESTDVAWNLNDDVLWDYWCQIPHGTNGVDPFNVSKHCNTSKHKGKKPLSGQMSLTGATETESAGVISKLFSPTERSERFARAAAYGAATDGVAAWFAMFIRTTYDPKFPLHNRISKLFPRVAEKDQQIVKKKLASSHGFCLDGVTAMRHQVIGARLLPSDVYLNTWWVEGGETVCQKVIRDVLVSIHKMYPKFVFAVVDRASSNLKGIQEVIKGEEEGDDPIRWLIIHCFTHAFATVIKETLTREFPPMMEFLKLCRNMMYNAPTRQQRYMDFQKEINNGTNGASPLLESFRSLLQSLKLKLISVDDASQIYKELISDVDMAPAECTWKFNSVLVSFGIKLVMV